MLQPINRFLNIWTLLDNLGANLTGKTKQVCWVLKVFSVVLLPIVYFIVFNWLVLKSNDVQIEYNDSSLLSKMNELGEIMLNSLEEWTTIINIICFLILAFTILFK